MNKTPSAQSSRRRPQSAETGSIAQSPPLSPVQELVCDEVADVLLYGRHPDSVDHLLHLAASQASNRYHSEGRFADQPHTSDDIRRIAGLATRFRHDWQSALISDWAKNRLTPPAQQPQPATVTGRIRQSIIERTRFQVEVFMAMSIPEEKALLLDILTTHEMGTSGPRSMDELMLAEAFQYVIDRHTITKFVRVPHEHRALVDDYLALLAKASENPRGV